LSSMTSQVGGSWSGGPVALATQSFILVDKMAADFLMARDDKVSVMEKFDASWPF
jgi:hypothetical protein